LSLYIVIRNLNIVTAAGPVVINSTDLIMKGATVSGWPTGHSLDCEETLVFSERHDIKVHIEKFGLKDAQKALESMQSGAVRFRAVLVMP
jgi:D-arabinose 1-dehydrogenase-like Zn-dependent alcohol dehydrogenase